MADDHQVRPYFHLRWDFSIEVGFLDKVRAPDSPAVFARRRMKSGDASFSWAAFRLHNERRAATPVPRYILFGGIVAPGKTDPVPWIFSGVDCYFPRPDCGLIADLLARVAAVAPPGAGEASRVFAASIEKPRERWTAPDFGVLHDAERSKAEIWQWQDACRFLSVWSNAKRT